MVDNGQCLRRDKRKQPSGRICRCRSRHHGTDADIRRAGQRQERVGLSVERLDGRSEVHAAAGREARHAHRHERRHGMAFRRTVGNDRRGGGQARVRERHHYRRRHSRADYEHCPDLEQQAKAEPSDGLSAEGQRRTAHRRYAAPERKHTEVGGAGGQVARDSNIQLSHHAAGEACSAGRRRLRDGPLRLYSRGKLSEGV